MYLLIIIKLNNDDFYFWPDNLFEKYNCWELGAETLAYGWMIEWEIWYWRITTDNIVKLEMYIQNEAQNLLFE